MAPILPPATIAMIGGGQLGRYALMSAAAMGYRTLLLEPDPSAPAGRVAGEHLVAPYDDPAALDRLGRDCEVVTVEFENPPAAALRELSTSLPVRPSASAVAVAQDRIAEKEFMVGQGFPVGPYVAVPRGQSVATVEGAANLLSSGPAVLKTARLGYDGKGQATVGSIAEADAACAEFGDVACVLETRLDLDAEVSVIVARRPGGGTAVYPAAENTHVRGILDLSVVPCVSVAGTVVDRAEGLALAIADALDFVGVLAVEFFVVGGEVLVNEIAPRPHNSGHWTLDGARTSQFEQQIRAVCGLGLGSTALNCGGVAMVNVLGDLWAGGEPDWAAAFDHPRTFVHLYGKLEARPGRKMGHLTVVADDPREAATAALEVRAQLTR